MPFVRIDTLESQHGAASRARIGEAVYAALRAIGVPEDDHFQVLTGKSDGDLVFSRSYLGIARGDGFVAVQITLNAGRTLAQKQALYAGIADRLAALGVRREDVFINLVEVRPEDWSFGNGVAQYAP
jgi:phenylpyruvate tautomerase PptA (4-oxalocrotonate tautomerase family)